MTSIQEVNQWRLVGIQKHQAQLAKNNLLEIEHVEKVVIAHDLKKEAKKQSVDQAIAETRNQIIQLLSTYAMVYGNWSLIDVNQINRTPGVKSGVLTDVTDRIFIAFMNRYF